MDNKILFGGLFWEYGLLEIVVCFIFFNNIRGDCKMVIRIR